MAFAPPNNALAWAHFRLRGGWVRAVTFTAATMALGAVLIITTARLNPNDGGRALWGWVTGLLSVQAVCLALYASGRVTAAVRQDVQWRMIESHRLMPLPPMHAIAGYILGSVAQPLIFSAGVFVLGGLTASAAGVDLGRWAFAHAVLLGFSAFVWVVCAFASFGAKWGGALLFFPLAIPYLSQGGVLALLPALCLLLSPVIGSSIFDLRTSGVVLPVSYAIAFAAQAYFGAICYVAAARKYRRADAIGVDTLLGLLLVLGWTATSFAALREWDDFRPRGWAPINAGTTNQLLASMVVGILVAMPAVSANAMERMRWRTHERLHDPAPLRRPMPIPIVIAAATAIVLLVCLAPHGRRAGDAGVAPITAPLLARSAACIALALLALYFLFDLLYTAGRRAGVLIFFWILLTWATPIIIDIARYTLGDMGESEPIAGFSSCSPVGALILLWRQSAIGTGLGILIQALLAALPGTLWALGRLRTGGSQTRG